MTGSTESASDIIRDLLHPTTSIREKALKELKINWNIDFREYLWKAIESENKKSLQNKMINLAIDKLGHKAMRKMIRFVEKDQLYPNAHNSFLAAYFRFENDEIRTALVKSLCRYDSNTYKFVCKLILSENIVNWDYDQFHSFFVDILQNEIPNDAKVQFIGAISSAFRTNRRFKILLRRDIIKIITDDELLYSAFLDALFKLNPNRFSYIRYQKSSVKTIWDDWKWEITGEWYDINEIILKLNDYDNLLIQSVTSKYIKVRRYAIRILAQQKIESSIPRFNEIYYQNLFDIWGDLVDENLDIKFMYIEEFKEDVLENFFISTKYQILQKMKDYKINHDLIYFIFAYLPRKYLLSLAENDPDLTNRTLAYNFLISKEFWMNNTKIIGPTITWIKTLKLCIRSLRFEEDSTAENLNDGTHIHDVVTRLALYLLNLLDNKELSISDEMITSLKSLKQNLVLSDNSNSELIRYNLEQLLGEPTPISKTTKISTETASIVFEGLLENIGRFNSKKSIINLIEVNSYEIKNILIEMIEKYLKNEKIFFKKASEDQLLDILDILAQDDDIRLRGKARLLKNNLTNN